MFSLFQITKSLAQTAASHSLLNVLSFYPSLIIPASPSLAVVCYPLPVVLICLLVNCVSEWPLE